MTLDAFQAVCTAVLRPPPRTKRFDELVRPGSVDRERNHDQVKLDVVVWKRPAREAKRTISAAAKIARRARSRDRQLETYGPGWCCIGVSMKPEVLAELDRAVAVLRAAGQTSMSRSKLLRIAFQRLDLRAVSEEP